MCADGYAPERPPITSFAFGSAFFTPKVAAEPPLVAVVVGARHRGEDVAGVNPAALSSSLKSSK